MSRFDKTYCSQCGGEFGHGDAGFSHCADHEQRAWQPIETAPIDEWVLIAATPDHVGQAIVYDDADINGNSGDSRRYEWAGAGPFHPNAKPLRWMPLPKYPTEAKS